MMGAGGGGGTEEQGGSVKRRGKGREKEICVQSNRSEIKKLFPLHI